MVGNGGVDDARGGKRRKNSSPLQILMKRSFEGFLGIAYTAIEVRTELIFLSAFSVFIKVLIMGKLQKDFSQISDFNVFFFFLSETKGGDYLTVLLHSK